MADKWRAEIEDLKLANPLIEETPIFQQHYLGKWVIDDSNLVYRFDYDRNSFDELPVKQPGAGRWHYVLGIDLGFNDPTAWVVCAYHDFDRTLYVLGAHKKEKCDITEVAEQTRKLMGRFDFDRIVIDNANKQAVEEMRRRHDIPLTPAEKAGKADFIEIMNGDFISGHIKLHKKMAAPLIDEYGQLIWDDRSGRREEHPAAPNHCCDAALYAWRSCYQYLADMLQPNGLRYGHSEADWMLMQEEREIEKLLQEKRNREAEMMLYEDPLDDYLTRH
jgi:hypothetical protein